MSESTETYLDAHWNRPLEELAALRTSPSIGTDPVHAPDMVRDAEALAGLLLRQYGLGLLPGTWYTQYSVSSSYLTLPTIRPVLFSFVPSRSRKKKN